MEEDWLVHGDERGSTEGSYMFAEGKVESLLMAIYNKGKSVYS